MAISETARPFSVRRRVRWQMWKRSTLPDKRNKIVENMRFSRAMTDLVINIREAVLRPAHNHPDLDAANARMVILLDTLAESFRAMEERAQELLNFMDGEGALFRQLGGS